MLFQHLVDPEYTPVADAEIGALVSAQVKAMDFLDDDDTTPPVVPRTARDSSLARQAFASLTADAPKEVQLQQVMALRTPEAVRSLVGMLSAYDWDFVEQAKQLRGYVVAKLMEESKGARASDRLRALQLLGTVTEVAAFTERKEVTHKHEGAPEIEERLRARLRSLLPPVMEVQDTEVKDIAVVQHGADVPKDPA